MITIDNSGNDVKCEYMQLLSSSWHPFIYFYNSLINIYWSPTLFQAVYLIWKWFKAQTLCSSVKNKNKMSLYLRFRNACWHLETKNQFSGLMTKCIVSSFINHISCFFCLNPYTRHFTWITLKLFLQVLA